MSVEQLKDFVQQYEEVMKFVEYKNSMAWLERTTKCIIVSLSLLRINNALLIKLEFGSMTVNGVVVHITEANV